MHPAVIVGICVPAGAIILQVVLVSPALRGVDARANKLLNTLYEQYRKAYGHTESGARFLNDIGGALRAKASDPNAPFQFGLGAGAVDWGIFNANPAAAIATGVVAGFSNWLFGGLAKIGIDRGKTQEQLELEREFAGWVRQYEEDRQAWRTAQTLLWILAILTPVVAAMAYTYFEYGR